MYRLNGGAAVAGKPNSPPTVMSRLAQNGDFLMAAGVLGLVLVMVMPMPPQLLDLLLASSIGLSILLFLTVLYAKKPVDLSIFPTLLLVATVLRLALNVASTRLILLGGHQGPEAAGKIIEAFGQFVVGGNFAVGLVVFSILVIINFVVITKGAGRVAEVAARFTLDAMPGKQMAIDAELNSGLIDEQIAKKRRAEISKESEFYGAMDGASKFVRGDAIAGIIITVINIVGGAFIGVIQNDLSIIEAAQIYTILTIGDGLVGQIPALIVSTAAGLLVTRVDGDDESQLHEQFGSQLLTNPRVVAVAAIFLSSFAIIPGLRIPFLTIGGTLGWLAFQLYRNPPVPESEEDAPEPSTDPNDARPEDLLPVEALSIEVGVDLLYLVDDRNGGELLQRIQRTRNQFAQDFGIVLPPINLRDNLRLESGEYSFQLRGEEIGSAKLHARKQLALDPGNARGSLQGIKTIDPVFGLPSYWISDAQVLKAQTLGFTVVDVPTVLTTHFVELMNTFAHELYDTNQLDRTLERVSQTNPKLVEELVPEMLSRQTVLRVFRALIREGLSVRDSTTILEALSDYAAKTKDPDILVEFVRQRLSRHITRRFADEEGIIHYVGLEPQMENVLLQGLQTQDGSAPNLIVDPTVAQTLFTAIQDLTENFSGPSQAVVLAPPLARGALRRMLERVMPRVVVLSSAELLPTVSLDRIGQVSLNA